MELETFIIIPAHNRKKFTLNCLRNLRATGEFEHAYIVVVDDGSKDGTSEMILSEFPEVILLRGDGSLYWTGAIEMGMRYAMSHGARCMVWLNDDSNLSGGSIERLVQVAVDTCGMASALGYVNVHTFGKNWYFPAQWKTRWGLRHSDVLPNTGLVPTDSFRGNLVAVSRQVVDRIGYPSGRSIPHVAGDTDYSLRASSSGVPCYILTEVLIEELDTIRSDNQSWLLGDIPLATLWTDIFSKKNSFYPPMRWVYLRRHWGWRGFLRFPLPYLKLVGITLLRMMIPRKLLIRLCGARSHAWNTTAWSRLFSGN
jgi:GT2 family glycosyltransferase